MNARAFTKNSGFEATYIWATFEDGVGPELKPDHAPEPSVIIGTAPRYQRESLSIMDLDKLAAAYLRDREEDFWAWQEVHQAVEADLNEGWKLVLLLLERAVSDYDIGRVAAGPLEDSIDRYGHKALDLVEEECRNNPRLRLALSTVAVLFYYDEFERWYGLLYLYGLRNDRFADSATITKIMAVMKSWLGETIGVYDYEDRIIRALDKPFEDKTAQRILQRVRLDVEVLDSKRPPGYREPYITRSELKARVEQAVSELEQLGYQASSID